MQCMRRDPVHVGQHLFCHITTQGPTGTNAAAAELITLVSKISGFSVPLKKTLSSQTRVWKSLSPEWAFCSGNAGQHTTSFSGSKSQPWRQTPRRDHGPWRPHAGAEETSKKEGEETSKKSEEQKVAETPTAWTAIASPKGPTIAMREKMLEWSSAWERGRKGVFLKYLMFVIFVSHYPNQ